MATLIIKYNENNKTAEEVLLGLIKSGAVVIEEVIDKKLEKRIKQSLESAEEIISDIEAGEEEFRTMDDVIAEL